jgi:hypothetical protein
MQYWMRVQAVTAAASASVWTRRKQTLHEIIFGAYIVKDR